MALVDADLKCIAIDVGSYGRECDSGIFMKSVFGKKIYKNSLDFPPPTSLPHTSTVQPYVIVGDEAFVLLEHMMKPYPRKQSLEENDKAIYNYRHSRARRTTENAFGVLCAYFRIFFTPIANKPETIDNIITSAAILHNL